ncbi:MAG: signal recognition particle protein [Candidatus Enterosoma sp.]|nr:signal recognition particle protein [Bacilli bacterium]MDY3907303.1 signal recognition particle protein [Candidatus Enterosoma sp.]
MAFESLGNKLSLIFKKMKGQATLSEKNMDEMLAEVRKALLEADVNYSVVSSFIEEIKKEAIGQKVLDKVSPGNMVVKIVYDKMEKLLGEGDNDICFNMNGKPTVIMMVGLQGTGKTTSAAKLANLFENKNKKKVLLGALDIYRPAAVDQLRNLGLKCSPQVDTFFMENASPVTIGKEAYLKAEREKYDILILDTAGRLEIDEKLMDELKQIQKEVKVDETLLTVDSLIGQNATNVALKFNSEIKITGLIMTKLDGDSRGGAALSIKKLTGIPIKYAGVGEKMEDLENFYPDRMASRILGMGDILSLVEEIQGKLDEKQAEKTSRRIMQGQFDLVDMLSLMKQMNKLGPLSKIISLIPNAPKLSSAQLDQAASALKQTEVIISSMTKEERRRPEMIKSNRKLRIAKGSGVSAKDVTKVLESYEQMKKQMTNYRNNPMMSRFFKK